MTATYFRGAGLLSAEASFAAGNVITATQADVGGDLGAGTLILEFANAASYDVFDLTDNSNLSEDAGTTAGMVGDWYLDFDGFGTTYGFRAVLYAGFNNDDFDVIFGMTTTWHNTDVRDILGFTGSETWEKNPNAIGSNDNAMLVATRRPLGVWYGGCPMSNPYGHRYAGHYQSDLRHSLSPLGHVKALTGNKMRVLRGVSWSHVPHDLAITDDYDTDGGVITNYLTTSGVPTRSFEEFFKDTQIGERAPFSAGSVIRLYWDTSGAVNFGNYDRYRMIGRSSTEVPMAVQGYDGLFTVALGDLIKVPT